MIKVSIIKDSEIVQSIKVESEQEADKWIQEVIESKAWSGEISFTKEDISSEIDQQQINREAKQYLDETDYYIIRMMDTGVPVPEGIQVLRQHARDRIQ